MMSDLFRSMLRPAPPPPSHAGYWWFWLACEICKSILPVIVASAVAYIAWHQLKTARQQAETSKRKLKLDLYDKRFAVVNRMSRLVQMVIKGNEEADTFTELFELNDTAQYLFDQPVQDLFAKLTFNIAGINNATEKKILMQADEQKREEMRKQKKDSISVLNHQKFEILDEVKPYLDFTSIE